MIERFRRLIVGDFAVLREIAEDPASTQHAVAMSAATFAVLAWIFDPGLQAPLFGVVLGLVGLVAWTGVLWSTGRIVGSKASPAQLLRGLGYVAPPLALAPIPLIGVAAGIGGVALQIAAIKHIGRVSTPRAAVATLPPWIGAVLFGVAVQSVAG